MARHAGVSLATASRVLNGSTRAVGERLAARVRASAEELGYLPNAPAQALARSSTATLGVLLHDVADPYFGAVARGVSDAATEAGLLTVLLSTDGDPEVELRGIRMLHAQRVRGLVLAGSAYTDPEVTARMDTALASYRAGTGSVAVVTDHGPDYPTVSPGNRTGTAQLTRAMLELGHRRFAVVSGPDRMRVPAERLAGVRQALAEVGLSLPERATVATEFSREGGRAAMARLCERLSPEEWPTVVLALSDVCAVGVLAELRDRGIAVPGELSVAGFDDIALAGDLAPALTTVRVPLERLGAEAVRMLLDPSTSTPGRPLELPNEVVLRASTAPPPS
ncbi:LacI family DNA-binding transcriptional regulator [Streptomyces sp. NPDC005438]|uniref:LacI family DNA-binding transcriptional regulator n=1 Tax=Streptomyces sp. NPDC005438 TaxID=3156880 RepID=UPI0033AA29E4